VAHKILTTPTSGADPTLSYGVDWNKLIDHLEGRTSTDPFTLNVDHHVFKHSTTNAAGDLLKGDGNRFVRWVMGSALQVPRVNAAGTDLEWHTPTSGTDDKVLVREAGVQVGSAARYLNFITASEFLLAEDVANSEIEVSIAAGGITNTHLAGSIADSKLLQITDKTKLHGSILYNDVDNSLGAHYLDFGEIGAPSSPASNVGRMFFDAADEHFKYKKSTGQVVDFESGAKGFSAGGLFTISQTDGTNKVFNIPHGLSALGTPTVVSVEPESVDALGAFTRVADATNIVVTYSVAPPTGSNNIKLSWGAGYVNQADSTTFTPTTVNTLTNKTISGASNTLSNIPLSSISTFIVSSPAPDHILKYNGANWVNETGITAASTLTFTNKTFGDKIQLSEVSTPADQGNTDDILIYDKQIDASNNALFAKYKEAGVIVEVRAF
jgi:hypothetical protein